MTSTSSTDDQVTQKLNPCPTIQSTITPMLSELKTKLAKLEEELYPKVEPLLEALLSQLEYDDSNLDQAIKSLSCLNDILCPSKRLFHAYEQFLNYDRIVLLCAKQYEFVYNTYVGGMPESEVKNPEDVKRAQRLLDITTATLTSILLGGPSKDHQFPRETFRKLVDSIFNYLLLWNGSHQATFTVRGIDGSMVSQMAKNILCGCPDVQSEAKPISSLRIGLLTVVLCEFRSMIQDTIDCNTEHSKRVREFNMAFNALAFLVECDAEFYFPPDTKNLSEFIYEIYAIYEICCQLCSDDSPYQISSLLRAIEAIHLYIIKLCTDLGNESVWLHFELVDKEIRDLKLNPEQVELFEFMAVGGYTRDNTKPKNVKTICLSNSNEVQQSESNLTIQTIRGTDSNASILDLDEEEYDGHPVLEPIKIAAAPKPAENHSDFEFGTEEDGLAKSFEFLELPVEPETTKDHHM